MEKERTIKSIVFFIAVTILIILIVTSSTNAFISSLVILKNEVIKGDFARMVVSVQPDSKNIFDINYILLRLKSQGNNSVTIDCIFSASGTALSGCRGITIEKTSGPSEYGYGYNLNQTLEYNILIDTIGSNYVLGTYSTSLTVFTKNKTFVKNGSDLKILPNTVIVQSCSIRAKDSLISAGGKEFKNPKLNFYIPLKNAARGTGYLIGQTNRTTFSYEFTDVKVLENDNDVLILKVSGKYRIGIGNKTAETSTITIHKKFSDNSRDPQDIVDIVGNDINIRNMDVTFLNGCK
jgi:hypothetical protein